jgi:L-iditol 2-dehydrogenase
LGCQKWKIIERKENKMRVAIYYSNKDIRIEDVPRPKVGPGEILISVKASGICGSDLMEWYRRDKAPLVLGHEVAGDIVEIGEGVLKYKIGERISASHHVPCYVCEYCLKGHHTVCETLRTTNFDPGGFAEFLKLSPIHVERGIYPLPDRVSYEEATFIEPLACVIRAQRNLGIKGGDSLLVLGSGIAGLLHIQLARFSGASPIIATDIHENRLQAALHFGADEAINALEYSPERLRKINHGRLADFVVVATSSKKAFEHAIRSVERGGKVLFFAPIDPDEGRIELYINEIFWRTDITLTTSYAGSPADHWRALRLIEGGRLKVREMITHRLSLEEAQLGFQLVANGRDAIKVILEPSRTPFR